MIINLRVSVILLHYPDQVQQEDDGFDLQLMARAEPGKPHDCALALAGVANVMFKTAETVSPGTDIQLLYLSPSQVSKGHPLTVTYTGEEIIQSFRERRTLMYGCVTDDPDHLIPVVRATEVNNPEVN